MKPVIGVTPLYDEEKDSIWMLPGYMDMLMECGAIPMILPFDDKAANVDQMLSKCDGLMLTGGHDVSPRVYGQQPIKECGLTHARKDALEQELLDQALEANIPILGICRGLQFINAALGGTLYQDLSTQRPSTLEHHMEPPYNTVSHSVELVPGTPLQLLMKLSTLEVNSYHHQGIRNLANCLKAMAVASDGLIEAAYHPKKRFCWGVQWHPEYLWQSHPQQRAIAQAFVNAC